MATTAGGGGSAKKKKQQQQASSASSSSGGGGGGVASECMADLQKLEEDKTAAFQSRMQRAKELKAEQERKQKLKQKQKQKQQQQQQKKLERPEEEEEASAGTVGATTHRKNSAWKDMEKDEAEKRRLFKERVAGRNLGRH